MTEQLALRLLDDALEQLKSVKRMQCLQVLGPCTQKTINDAMCVAYDHIEDCREQLARAQGRTV